MRIAVPNQFETGYFFEPGEIREAITLTYAEFLKEAGYVDLERTPNLFVASHLLKVDEKVERAAKELGVSFYDNRGTVTKVNQDNARRLIHALGGNVLTSAFMFRLVVPELKSVEGTSGEAMATLTQMKNDFAEYLEDRVLDKTRLIISIGQVQKELVLPEVDGYFGKDDLNDFGYPNAVKQSGEFYYLRPSGNDSAAVRGRYDSGPGLCLNREPGCVGVGLGVRFAKFF